MKNIIAGCCLFIVLSSCKDHKNVVMDANQIIDKAINVAGGDIIERSTIAFKFRDMYYKAYRNNGAFNLERFFTKDSNQLKDVVNNKGFQRYVNDVPLAVIDSMATKYAASVNSVHYFSVLPYGLNNEAVNKTLLGKVQLDGKSYFKIEVTFDAEGGGEDYEDVFVYWVHSESYKVDYLAYSYNESDGLGFRFREAYNERYVEGIRIVDYKNYKPKSEKNTVYDLDELFKQHQLELLSTIDLEDIKVTRE